MQSQFQNIIANKDETQQENLLERLSRDDNWSAISFIDELIPGLLFEANLTYGNFHQVKMAVFLRKLARENKLSRQTLTEVMRLLLQESRERSWLNVQVGDVAASKKISDPLEQMLTELSRHNIHNAMYYALQAYKQKPEKLQDLLLCLGGVFGPENLGHSLSCFFPVMQELVNSHHPAAETAIFSYLLYLGRYGVDASFSAQQYSLESLPDNAFRLASSGEGIANLHHMITLAVYKWWEKADFHDPDFPLPYKVFYQKRLAGKNISSDRMERVSKSLNLEIPEDYSEFYRSFAYDDVEFTTRLVRAVFQEQPDVLWDWIIRLYAQDYDPESWNPHFYTGIYLALKIKEEDLTVDEIGAEMAIDQAVAYYINSMA